MRVLTFDVETHSADLLYDMLPAEFVRLIGYAWGKEDVVLATDLEELKEQILKADLVIGHNIHNFDLKAVFGSRSDVPLHLSRGKKVFDTWVHAALVNPAPYVFTNRHGVRTLADSPRNMKRWFSLDEQAHQLGVQGKTADLKALAKEFGGFGSIPVEDERFRSYLVGDVEATRRVAKELLKIGPLNSYAMREQEIAARAAIISSNGVRVCTERAIARVQELRTRKEEVLRDLQSRYGLPDKGKSPWATKAGKAAIMAALADQNITPETRADWTKTATGNLSLGGETLIDLTKGTPAADMGRALAELKGQRSLAQLALDSTHADGFVHPDITMLQRSGRWSTTEPGLTIWTSRGEGAIEKSYFLPDDEYHMLMEFDYSNADARIVAAYSGDTKYAERFQPGADGHMINALSAWGEVVVKADMKKYRQLAKPLGHGWSYGGRAGGLSSKSGIDIKVCYQFVNGMDRAFPQLIRWQNEVRKEAAQGYVVSEWGRKLWVEEGREFTQAPALKGQNGTREIVCDALLRMPIDMLRRVKAQIHDALLFSVPKENWGEWGEQITQLMQTTFKPSRGGQTIDFPVTSGPPGDNWQEAGHD